MIVQSAPRQPGWLGEALGEPGAQRRLDMAAVPSLTFGALLRRYRLAAGLTQEALGELAGLSLRGIADLERGARTHPRQETVQLLAEALRLSAPERAQLEAAARGRVVSALPASTAQPLHRVSAPTVAPLVGRAQELELLERHLVDGPPLF